MDNRYYLTTPAKRNSFQRVKTLEQDIIRMSDKSVLPSIHISTALDAPIGELNTQLEGFLVSVGLPTAEVVATITERKKIISALSDALSIIPSAERSKSNYLSRFTIAIAAGLFDGALNYLWDETVKALRQQVISFDIQYFYSIAEKINYRYKNLSKPEDIDQVSEHDLLDGCRRIGLISDVNYQRLFHVHYMRNHASAAHPNENSIDGYEMLSWLTVCIKHVITAEPDLSLISIKQLLQNIRSEEIPATDFKIITQDLEKQPQERIDDFLWAIFGIFVDEKSPQNALTNIQGLAPGVWSAASEDRKYDIGAKFGIFRKNGEVPKKDACQKFLENVGGISYKDEDSLAGELIEKLENLYRAHFSNNNFYNEYPHVKSLNENLPPSGKIPRATRSMWVKVICLCYIGNGFGYRQGVDEQALPFYELYIARFNDVEILEFIRLFQDPEFTSVLFKRTPESRVKKLATTLLGISSNIYLQKALKLIIAAPTNSLENISITSDYKQAISQIVI